VEAKPIGDEWHVVVDGACTFLALPRLTRVLSSIRSATAVALIVSSNASITLHIGRLPTGSDSMTPRVAPFASIVDRDRPPRSPTGARLNRTRKAQSRCLIGAQRDQSGALVVVR